MILGLDSQNSSARSAPWRASFYLALLLFSQAISVAIPRVANAEERRSVMAVLAASPAVIERLIPLLRATMDGQGLALTAVNAPQIDLEDAVRAVPEWSTSGPLAYLWLDLLSKQPTMVLVEPRSSLVHVRPLAVHPDPDMVETELIRFVVRSSLEAILKGQAQGVTREKFAPEKLETCVAATPARISTIDRTPARSRSKWMVGVGYSGAILTGDSIVHGPELGVELRRPNFHLSATLLQSLPLTVTQSGLGTRLASSGIRIVAAVPVAIGPRTSASIGLGAGVDATHVAPSGLGATSAFWATDPLALGVAEIERAWGNVFVSMRAGVEWDFFDTHYLVIRQNGTSVLWSPGRWRPFLALHVSHEF